MKLTREILKWLKKQPNAVAEINARGISVEQYVREHLFGEPRQPRKDVKNVTIRN